MSDIVFELRGVKRSFMQGGQVLEVLRGVDLRVKRGEIVALVGASGSGKSTLLQIAGLLDTPSSGEIIIQGNNAEKADDDQRTMLRRNHLGFVYQFHHLLPEFSATENIALPQMVTGVPYHKAAARAVELLDGLGLAKRAEHRPAELSGGEQQRVAIARALANDPALILADEPTGNLDPHTSESVFNLFIGLAKSRGLSAIVATHNMELARRMDRIVTMQEGLLAHA